MSSFISIEVALNGWFEKSFNRLPKNLQILAEPAFRSTPWEKLTPQRRRARARKWDDDHDPAAQEQQRLLWDLVLRMDDLQKQIEEFENTDPVSVSEILLKKKNLEELESELKQVTDKFWCSKSNPEKQSRAKDHYQPSTARRDARKLETRAMHERWRKAYRDLKRKHPDKSDVWYSLQIAKTEGARRRSAETIRKQMKKQR